MSNAKPLDLSLPYQVADISLADFGKREMQLSEREMPGLMELIRRYGDKKPLKGFKVMGSLHMTIQTAVLIETLVELGADVRCTSSARISAGRPATSSPRRITPRPPSRNSATPRCSRGRVKRLRIIGGARKWP